MKSDLRTRAVFWIGTYDEDVSARALRDLANDNRLDEDVRGAAIVAMGTWVRSGRGILAPLAAPEARP